MQTSFGDLPLPRTPDDAAAILGSMPDRLENWTALPGRRGLASHDHPDGPLMVEAGELADIYVRPVTAAEAIRRIRFDLDAGSAEECATPPDRCVTGRMDGQVGVVWGHDDSEVLIAAVWPDDRARTALLAAWSSLS